MPSAAFNLAVHRTVTIRRNPCSPIVLTNQSVLRADCEVELERDEVVVSDMGNTAETLIIDQ